MMEKSAYFGVSGESADASALHLDVTVAGHFRSGADYSLPPRVLDREAVLIFTRRGEGRVRSGSESFVAGAGDAFLLLPGTEHEYRTHQEHWELLWFHCQGTLLDHLAHDARSGCLPPVACGSDSVIETSTEAVIKELKEKALLFNRAAAAHAHLALVELQRSRLQNLRPASQAHRQVVPEILTFIHAHVDQALTVKTLETQFNISARHLVRVFRKEVGQSPKAYILSAKLAEAKRLLTMTDQTISHVARHVGFTDPYYFSRLFQEKVGRSPSEFRATRAFGC